jgi:DNA-binding transcriptional ArsR family regulator
MRAEHGISQPATSQHLKVLLEVGLVSVRPAGRQRIYAVDPAGVAVAMAWLQHFTDTFAQPLDALETELVRGRRDRRRTTGHEDRRRDRPA